MQGPVRGSRLVVFSTSLLMGALLGSLATIVYTSGMLLDPSENPRELHDRLDVLCHMFVARTREVLVAKTRAAIAADNDNDMRAVLQCTDDQAGLIAEAVASPDPMKRP